MTTAEQRAAWTKLAEAATKGPWEVWTSNSFRRITGPSRVDGGVLSGTVQRSDGQPDLCGEKRDDDLAFIVAAREAVPALLADVEALRKALQMTIEMVERPLLATDPIACRRGQETILDSLRTQWGL